MSKDTGTTDTGTTMKGHAVVSRAEWLEARKAFLAKEKDFTRLRDELSRQRRALPWVKVDASYAFDGPRGKESLADLFDGRSQLVVYHFMFGPEATHGCKHCSFWADNFDPNVIHLNHRDVTFVAISRAPLDRIEAFRKRMGWGFKWLSSGATAFNFDYGVSFRPEDVDAGRVFYNYSQPAPKGEREGVSVFYKDADGVVYHTYSCYARGIDMLNTAYHYLDLVPRGRDEHGQPQSWVRYHDQY